MLCLGRQLTEAVSSGPSLSLKAGYYSEEAVLHHVPVTVDTFMSQAAPWELARAACRQVLCGERAAQ